jgi:single-stranded-DNA-specific exonuclease
MKSKWVSKYSEKITKKLKPKEILGILASNRGVRKSELENFINPLRPKELTPEMVGLKSADLTAAVSLIKDIGPKKKIIIYGDYDIDGLTATGIIWEALWNQGYNVLPYIPSRETGYGLNKKIIRDLIEEHPDLELLITVDNGIVAEDEVKFAQKHGLKVIVTDHHLQGKNLPPAEVIIHTTEIAGCAVAWFLAREFGYQLTDLAALGTIGDLLPALGSNRSLIKYGLKEMGKTKRQGIKMLKKIAGIPFNEPLEPWQVSFILGPRLNAAGRIANPMLSLQLLCTKNRKRAIKLAKKLDSLNRQRQDMMSFSVSLAEEISLEKNGLILTASPDFHPGIIGLIAGKLSEKYSKPVIAVSRGDEVCKGSARSVSGVDIVEIIRQTEDILIDVGGHPMAAGFSVKADQLDELFERLHTVAGDLISEEDLIAEKEIDFEIDFSLINKHFYQLTQKLSPFGVGNPKPTFLLSQARVVNTQLIGNDNSHLKLWLDDPEAPKIERISAEAKSDLAEAIGFGWGDWGQKLSAGDTVNLVFSFNLNQWNGKETLQLKIKDLELC